MSAIDTIHSHLSKKKASSILLPPGKVVQYWPTLRTLALRSVESSKLSLAAMVESSAEAVHDSNAQKTCKRSFSAAAMGTRYSDIAYVPACLGNAVIPSATSGALLHLLQDVALGGQKPSVSRRGLAHALASRSVHITACYGRNYLGMRR